MKKRRLNLALADIGMISMRGFEPLAFRSLLTLEAAASETLMGGDAVTPAADASQTGEAKPGETAAPAPVLDAEGKPVVVDPATKQTPTAEETAAAEAKAKTEAEAAAKAALKAPEKYEFKMPEGVTMDAEVLGEFEGIARELDLTQEGAQKLADMGSKLTQRIAAQQVAGLEKAAAEWVAQAKADPEYGGEKLQENLAIAVKARDAFASPALRAMLKDSKLVDHPEVIRMWVKIGKAISEDKMVTGGAGAAADKPIANALYPNQK